MASRKDYVPIDKDDPEPEAPLPYTLPNGESAEETYNRLASFRASVENMAERLAKITIPSLFPPLGTRVGDQLNITHGSVAARCVNNLASRLMFTGFPPGRPMHAYTIKSHKLTAEEQQDPELLSKLNLSLSKLEQAHRHAAEATPLRMNYTMACKHLIVAGNVLWKHEDVDCPQFYSIRNYVVKRDNVGRQMYVVLKEMVIFGDLDDDLQQAIMDRRTVLGGAAKGKPKPNYEDEVPLYTCTILNGSHEDKPHWSTWQEVDCVPVPDSYGEDPYEAPTLYAAWMIPSYGDDWGRSYCEEYEGDLVQVDNFGGATQDGAAAAAWSLIFVKPGTRTRKRDVETARNLKVLTGSAEDVTISRSDKTGDFQFVANLLTDTERRLAFAFLLNSAIQRTGERVTAEEIGVMAQELEQAMGGLYSALAQTFQRHVVIRFILLNEESEELPPTDPRIVATNVVTGIDALGRTEEYQNLKGFMHDLAEDLTPPVAGMMVSKSVYARRLAAARGIDPQELVLDAATVSSNLQTQQQTHIKGVAGEAMAVAGAKAMAQGTKDIMTGKGQIPQALQQQQQPPPAPPAQGAA